MFFPWNRRARRIKTGLEKQVTFLCAAALSTCALSLATHSSFSSRKHKKRKKKITWYFALFFNDLFFNRYNIVWNQPELELFCFVYLFALSNQAMLMKYWCCFSCAFDFFFFLFSQLLVIAARYAAVLRRHDEIERERGLKEREKSIRTVGPFFPLSAQVIRHGALVNCTRSESSLSLRSLTVCSQKGPIIKI